MESQSRLCSHVLCFALQGLVTYIIPEGATCVGNRMQNKAETDIELSGLSIRVGGQATLRHFKPMFLSPALSSEQHAQPKHAILRRTPGGKFTLETCEASAEVRLNGCRLPAQQAFVSWGFARWCRNHILFCSLRLHFSPRTFATETASALGPASFSCSFSLARTGSEGVGGLASSGDCESDPLALISSELPDPLRAGTRRRRRSRLRMRASLPTPMTVSCQPTSTR